MLLLGLISLFYKSIPQSYRDYLETKLPRLANLFRVFYSLGPDLIKTIQSSKLILTGESWRDLDPTKQKTNPTVNSNLPSDLNPR